MKKDLLDRLKKYSLGASAIMAGTAVNAQMVYTDIPDDTISGNGNSYSLDLDNNSSIDFTFSVSSSNSSWTTFQWSTQNIRANVIGNNRVMIDSSSSVYALNNGSNINAAANFGTNGRMVQHFFFSSTYFSSTSSSNSGNWLNASDKYVGLKLVISGQTHYGWARITVLSPNEFIIKDYAYQAAPNVPITAGDTSTTTPPSANPAMNVVGADVANNRNGMDLQVSFDTAANESSISSYRILVVPEADTTGFNLAAAQAIGTGLFTPVTPNGSNISQTLFAISKDVNGASIVENQPYRVFILSKANLTTAFFDALSEMSNQVILTTPIVPCEPATAVVAADIDNNGNGSDLSVEFNKASDESGIAVYKVIISKEATASTFNLAAAQALNNSQFVNVPKTGSNLSVVLTANLRDTDGDLIVENEPYRAFVQSIANNTTATKDTLSTMSNEVTLIGPIADISPEVTLADIANNGNGLDMKVSFTKAQDETTINVYRVIIVKTASVPTFDLFSAEALTTLQYKTLYPTGSNLEAILNAAGRDSDGDLITHSVPYKAFVLSMADGTNALINSLSAPSNEVTLDKNVGISETNNSSLSIFQRDNSILISSEDGQNITHAKIMDMGGRLIAQENGFSSQLSINVAGLSSGVYIVEAKSDNETVRQTIFISGN